MTETACPYCEEFEFETCPFHASPDLDAELRAATDQAKIAADEQGG